MYLKLQMICCGDYSGTASESHMHVIEALLLEESLYRNWSKLFCGEDQIIALVVA